MWTAAILKIVLKKLRPQKAGGPISMKFGMLMDIGSPDPADSRVNLW